MDKGKKVITYDSRNKISKISTIKSVLQYCGIKIIHVDEYDGIVFDESQIYEPDNIDLKYDNITNSVNLEELLLNSNIKFWNSQENILKYINQILYDVIFPYFTEKEFIIINGEIKEYAALGNSMLFLFENDKFKILVNYKDTEAYLYITDKKEIDKLTIYQLIFDESNFNTFEKFISALTKVCEEAVQYLYYYEDITNINFGYTCNVIVEYVDMIDMNKNCKHFLPGESYTKSLLFIDELFKKLFLVQHN